MIESEKMAYLLGALVAGMAHEPEYAAWHQHDRQPFLSSRLKDFACTVPLPESAERSSWHGQLAAIQSPLN